MRSTVPLLDFWRVPGERLEFLSDILGADFSSPVNLAVEYTVPVQLGSGKPSCTDLMILSPNSFVAVEAKFTEPRYETVEEWLRAGSLNRVDVLRGWLNLLESMAARPVTFQSVARLPYQLIHRAASACSTAASRRIVLYHVFSENVNHYVVDIRRLVEVLGPSAKLRFWVIATPAVPRPVHLDLQARWRTRREGVGEAVKAALLSDTLFDFPASNVSDSPSVVA